MTSILMRARLVWTTILLLLAAAILFTEAQAASRIKGQYAVFDNRCLHYVEFGDPKGDVTVILEAGGGGFSAFWLSVQREATRIQGVRFIAYDRAGLGWSDPRPGPYAIEDDADDLAALLDTLKIDEPVLLVAHSYGSFVAKLFAERHVERLTGLVLVDPNTAAFFQDNAEVVEQVEASADDWPMNWLERLVARTQSKRFAAALGGGQEINAAFDRYLSRPHQVQTAAFLARFGETVAAVSTSSWPDRSLLLISRGQRDAMFPWTTDTLEESWRRAHLKLVRDAPQATLWLAQASGHAVPMEQPDLIIDAVQTMVDVIREGRRPASNQGS